MKRFITLIFFVIFISACSSEEAGDASSDRSVEMNDFSEEETEGARSVFSDSADGEEDVPTNSQETLKTMEETNRKVIYTADMTVEVDSFKEIENQLRQEASRLGGYIVESNLYNNHTDELKSGEITLRIPHMSFQIFIEVIEQGSTRVIEQVISGQDVTEEFVDLESRLKSKKRVEERLLEFMEGADKTDDLLAISSDLAKVQEEMETIIGRMNYLQDKTDFSTVTVRIYENNVTLSTIDGDDLDTWEETKKQFMRSINFIISATSIIIIFFVGNLPVLILAGILILSGYFIWRKKRK